MSAYIKTLTTNAKNPRGTATWTLGPKTLIVGPNESGKSAIAQSAQLIAEGGASGLLLRKGLVKLPAQLAALAPAGQPLTIEATLDNGDVVKLTMEPGKQPKIEGKRTPGISVEAVRAAFSGSADTARRFIAEHVPMNAVGWKELRAAIPETYRDRFTQLAGDKQQGHVSFDGLYSLVEQAEAKRKEHKTDADRSAATIQALGVGVVPGSAGQVSDYFDRVRMAILADFFRSTGPTAKQASDDGDPEPLKAVRWLAAQIGGKAALAAAMPSENAKRDFMGLAGNVYAEELTNLTRSHMAHCLTEAEAWGNLASVLHDFTTILLDTNLLPVFEKRVNTFLPPGDTFQLDRKALYPGLMRNGRLHVALSGSTEARVLAAITASLADADSLNIVVVDDRMWDSGTLARMLSVLEDAACQVIVMSTFGPRGRRRQGWTLIELEDRYTHGDEDESPAQAQESGDDGLDVL